MKFNSQVDKAKLQDSLTKSFKSVSSTHVPIAVQRGQLPQLYSEEDVIEADRIDIFFNGAGFDTENNRTKDHFLQIKELEQEEKELFKKMKKMQLEIQKTEKDIAEIPQIINHDLLKHKNYQRLKSEAQLLKKVTEQKFVDEVENTKIYLTQTHVLQSSQRQQQNESVIEKIQRYRKNGMVFYRDFQRYFDSTTATQEKCTKNSETIMNKRVDVEALEASVWRLEKEAERIALNTNDVRQQIEFVKEKLHYCVPARTTVSQLEKSIAKPKTPTAKQPSAQQQLKQLRKRVHDALNPPEEFVQYYKNLSLKLSEMMADDGTNIIRLLRSKQLCDLVVRALEAEAIALVNNDIEKLKQVGGLRRKGEI